MSKFLIRAALIIIAVAANIALPELRSATPNFLFLLVVIYAFREENQVYLSVALFGGILFDIYSRSAFGSYIIGLLLIGLLIRMATGTLFRSEPRSATYMTVAIIASNVLLIAFLYLYNTLAERWQPGVQALTPLYIIHAAWLSIIFNLIFAGPIYFLVNWLESIISRYNTPRNMIR